MRITIPTIPNLAHLTSVPAKEMPVHQAIEKVANFLRGGNIAVLTGAGVSVDSGIRAYRGKDGRYMNPNYK